MKTVASQNAERTDRGLVADMGSALGCLVQGGGTARSLSLSMSVASLLMTSASASQQPRCWRAVQIKSSDSFTSSRASEATLDTQEKPIWCAFRTSLIFRIYRQL